MSDKQTVINIENAKTLILRNGGSVIDRVVTVDGHDTREKIVNGSGGVKILGAIDCLINYGGFVKGSG